MKKENLCIWVGFFTKDAAKYDTLNPDYFVPLPYPLEKFHPTCMQCSGRYNANAAIAGALAVYDVLPDSQKHKPHRIECSNHCGSCFIFYILPKDIPINSILLPI